MYQTNQSITHCRKRNPMHLGACTNIAWPPILFPTLKVKVFPIQSNSFDQIVSFCLTNYTVRLSASRLVDSI